MAPDTPFRKPLTGVSTFFNPTIPSDVFAAFSSVRFLQQLPTQFGYRKIGR